MGINLLICPFEEVGAIFQLMGNDSLYSSTSLFNPETLGRKGVRVIVSIQVLLDCLMQALYDKLQGTLSKVQIQSVQLDSILMIYVASIWVWLLR